MVAGARAGVNNAVRKRTLCLNLGSEFGWGRVACAPYCFFPDRYLRSLRVFHGVVASQMKVCWCASAPYVCLRERVQRYS
jgi:hypothetical protein